MANHRDTCSIATVAGTSLRKICGIISVGDIFRGVVVMLEMLFMFNVGTKK